MNLPFILLQDVGKIALQVENKVKIGILFLLLPLVTACKIMAL